MGKRNKIAKYKPSIGSAVVRTFRKPFLITAPMALVIDSGVRLIQPLLIGRIVKYLAAADEDHLQGVSYDVAAYCVAGLIASTIIILVVIHHSFVFHLRYGNNARQAITQLVYKKVLRLSMSSFQETDVGQILNILANDMNRFEEVAFWSLYLFIAPMASIICLAITYYFMGTSSLSGFLILILFIPFQGIMGRLFSRFRRNSTRITDTRVNLMSEIVSAMKLIKVYCWEQPFARIINDIRTKEIDAMKKTYFLEGVNSAVFFVATKVILFACFITHVLRNGSLDAEMVFVTMSIYNVIRVPVTRLLPNAVGLTGECLVALSRVNNILLLEERPDDQNGNSSNSLAKVNRGVISMENYRGKWTKKVSHNNLQDINLKINPGELLMVVGSVGSGKTCFLYSLLNEIEKVSGSCNINGSISYAPQDTWCFGGTVRQNILLLNQMNRQRYKEVIDVCGLERDLTLFDLGDKTFVGEKGYNLSGGQKARVSLARAVYNDADYYLLDDPLSAVDSKIANHIFDKCIKEYLKEKTVVLVTHQLQFLQKADKIAYLKDGKLNAFGEYNDLINNSPAFIKFLDKVEKEEARKESMTKEKSLSIRGLEEVNGIDIHSIIDKRLRGQTKTRASSIIESGNDAATSEVVEFEENFQGKEQDNSNDRQEKIAGGAVNKMVFWDYFKSGGSYILIMFVVFTTLTSQALYHYTDLWLAAWTQADYSKVLKEEIEDKGVNRSALDWSLSEEQKSLASQSIFHDPNYNIILYTILTILLFLASFSRILSSLYLSLKCSINLHDKIFRRLLRAPLTFFENNPLGRILNRFTRDIGIIDVNIPRTMVEFNLSFCDCLGIILVSILVKWYMIFPTIILFICSLPIREYYVRTGRDLNRLDSVARSPVYHHLTATYDGLITIRAFKLQERCEQQYLRYLSDSTACRFLVFYATRVLAVILDLFAIVYVICICIVLMETPKGTIPGGDAGLILSQSLLLIGAFQYCVRMSSDLENQMTSTERVLEYGNLPSEAELRIEGKVEDKNWPAKGNIVFKGVSLKYTPDLPPVLKDLTFRVKPGEKIGIVGRTGAGKSSLISILFRLVEPEGQVLVDGVDIKTLGLHELRSKVSIIPQDPSLFSGTVRDNLDPFKEYNDSHIWEALSEAHLTVTIRAMGGLDAKVSEGGGNLSVGQRQLLCMARALLKKNKILVMDEATANVDQETDDLIQKTIKTTFVNNTVLTVAHRLNTIIDMDKVLVMDAGRVVEFDEPYTLLRDITGVFYSMVRQTGPEFEKMLHSMAEKSHFDKLNKIEKRKHAVGDL